MSNPVVSDFIITLYVFREVIKSKDIITKTIVELKDFFLNIRALRHSIYFDKNQWIQTNYYFVKKNIDFLFP